MRKRFALPVAVSGVILALLCPAGGFARGEPAPSKVPPVVPAGAAQVLAAARAPGARAVLVNVWATWCDACRDEMPALVRVYRAHRAAGLRLILVSVDEAADRDKAAKFLASQGVDFPSWLKHEKEDDMKFIEALEPRWTGALPASFLYDGDGKLQRRWQGEVTAEELERALAGIMKRTGRNP